MKRPFPPIVEAGRFLLSMTSPNSPRNLGTIPNTPYGAFLLENPLAPGELLKIIVGPCHRIGNWWEHVSVSCKDRTPTWEEMCYVKDLFWNDEDLVVQFHPPKSLYINDNVNVLHLWRPTRHRDRINLPPKELV